MLYKGREVTDLNPLTLEERKEIIRAVVADELDSGEVDYFDLVVFYKTHRYKQLGELTDPTLLSSL